MDVYGCLWMIFPYLYLLYYYFFSSTNKHVGHQLFGLGTMLKFVGLQEMLTSLGDPMQEHEAKDLIYQLSLRLTFYI